MRLIRSLLALLFFSVTAAVAQSTAPLRGRVVDTTGTPVEGAEVTLADLLRRTQTNASGQFQFDSVPRGGWVTRVRKIGFKQQVLTIEADTGSILFRLAPAPSLLAPVVTVASKLGLSGFVRDASGKPVPDARVRVLGIGLQTTTDSAGAFWLQAPAGSHMVAASKKSYAEKLAGVTIPPDSGRNVTIWLRPAASIAKVEAFNVEDLRERLAWGMKTSQTLWTRERLEKEEIDWIYDVVQLVWRRSGHVTDINRECWVLVNGGPDIAPLVGLTTDDVESVEIYSKWHEQSATVKAAAPRSANGQGGQFIQPMALTYYVKKKNGGKSCLAVYVWLR